MMNNLRQLKTTGIQGLTVAIGASAALLVLAAPAYGDPGKVECKLNTLKGQYLVYANGTLFPPAFGVTAPSVSAAAGYSIYNGDGTGEDFVTFTVNGVDQHVPSPQPFTYTLNQDCTGTRTVLPYGPHFDIFVGADGEALTEIATDTGFAVATFDKRVRP